MRTLILNCVKTKQSIEKIMSAVVQEERYVFETEWFDAQASLIRKYLLTYYPRDRTIDMVSRILARYKFKQKIVDHHVVNLIKVRFEKPQDVFEEDGVRGNGHERTLCRLNRDCSLTPT